MKKSIVILAILFVSVCAFAGNNKPTTTTQKPPVKIEKKVTKSKPVLKPAPNKKIAKMQKMAAQK